MKLLITGAGGQLGRQWEMACITANISHHAVASSGLDITDNDAVRSVLDHVQPDVLINCAAYTKVDQAESEPDLAANVNAEAVGILAGECKARSVKLVHYSTDYVFSGDEEDKHRLPEGYPEDHAKNPVNVYGHTKSAGEDHILESNVDHLIFRVSWLCGIYGSNFLHTMLRLGRERDQLNVVNDQFGCPAFTGDVVEQSLHLLKNNEKGIFHLGSGGLITWHEFATAIFESAKMDTEVLPVSSDMFKTTAQRPSFSKLDTSKAENAGARIPYWKDALNEVIELL